MDFVFLALAAGLWGVAVLLVRGFEKLQPGGGGRS